METRKNHENHRQWRHENQSVYVATIRVLCTSDYFVACTLCHFHHYIMPQVKCGSADVRICWWLKCRYYCWC